MIPAQFAIARFNRDLTLGRVLNAVLVCAVVACFFFGGAVDSRYGDVVLVLVVGGIWILLGYYSIRGSQLAAGSGNLIASGQFDLAEHQIETALRSFSLFRATKLVSLHHLAVLRHAQRRWGDAADLCRAFLRQRPGSLNRLSRQSRLILAESLLELGDVHGAYAAIQELYSQRLTLAEALALQAVQLDYLWRVNAWELMMATIETKVQLVELMNGPSAARSLAFLALAAEKLKRAEWAEYLRRRVALLCDVHELVEHRPILKELFGDRA